MIAVVIKTVCGWCGTLICDGPLSEDGLVSHGICQDCKKKVFGYKKA